ncbi:MAG: hypothetical protein FJ102_07705 [Deltaproteobacteria bacterium]|nr:hypothetical protein [Deltaproteobacteria bacterium]
MPRQRRAASTTDRAARVVNASAREALREADAQQLRRLGKALGNDALQGKIAGNDKLRDALLALVQERLQAIQLAQQAEMRAMRNRADWYRRLLRGEKGVMLPEPGRWAAPAQLYKKAAEAICAGELGRGADLLKQATEADRATFKSVPEQVEISSQARAGPEAGAAVLAVREGEGCNPTTAPRLLALADTIVNAAQRPDLVGALRPLRPHQWWEVEVDEDEEKKQKDDPKKSARLRQPAAQGDTGARDRDAFLRKKPRK